MLERLQPGLLLLLWCGIAATIVARPVARSGHAQPRASGSRRRRLLALALDVLFFPILYALILEAIGRADILTGAVLGLSHAAISLAATMPRAPADEARHDGARLRAFLARTLYGIVFAFLYVVPAA